MSRNYLCLFSMAVSAALLGGCATITPVSGRFPDITPRAAQSGTAQGKQVRWGGKLIETRPEAHETCFTVLGEPLRRDGRPEPERGEAHTGRFLACARAEYAKNEGPLKSIQPSPCETPSSSVLQFGSGRRIVA